MPSPGSGPPFGLSDEKEDLGESADVTAPPDRIRAAGLLWKFIYLRGI